MTKSTIAASPSARFPPATSLSAPLLPYLSEASPRFVIHLVKWVGAGAPPGKEDAEADGFDKPGDNTDSDQFERTLLGDNASDNLKKGQPACGPGGITR